MLIVEMRGSTYDHMFELIDKARKGTKKTKCALYELEECLEHCYELDTNDDYEVESDYEDGEMTDGIDISIDELNYRRGMRRKGMRDGMYHDTRYYEMRKPSMRRGRTGRYSY